MSVLMHNSVGRGRWQHQSESYHRIYRPVCVQVLPSGRNILQPSADTKCICRLTAIIISRFLLELQQANQMVVRLDPDDPLHSSSNAWDTTPSFISSIGGFINPARSARSDDDDDDELRVHSSSDGGEGEGGGQHKTLQS